MSASGAIRATFELEPHGSAEALAIEESTGMPGLDGYDHVRGVVVEEGDGRAVIDFPAANWGRNVAMLVSAIVAGEAVETGAFSRCRLVALELPDGLLPGPAHDAVDGARVGVIVKPSLGLTSMETANIARTCAEAGAWLVKDDELMGDPMSCPLEDRVRAVADVLPPDVVYCPNITGPTASLLDRASRVVELGATGVMVNAFAQGLDAVLALRDAELGVPLLAHRVGSGPMARGDRYGVAGDVLVKLLRLCGADFVIAGAYGGKLFDSDDEVDANVRAAHEPIVGTRTCTAIIGGGVGPDNVRAQADRAGGDGLLMLLGSAAYRAEGGVGASVRATVEALA